MAIPWEIIIPAVSSLAGIALGSFGGYYFGRRAKIDEIKLAKTAELGTQITALLHMINDQWERLHFIFSRETEHQGFQAFVNELQVSPIWQTERVEIQRLGNNQDACYELNKTTAIYFSRKFRNLISDYIKLGQFPFLDDGIGITSEYYEGFVRNLIDKNGERLRIYGKLESKFEKII
jgi:hypothetical protein